MYDEVTMAIRESRNDLAEKSSRLFFSQFAALLVSSDVFEEISACRVLHDQSKLVFGLNDFKKANNVGMIQTCHDLGFCLNTVGFNNIKARFVDNLDCHLHSSRQMLSKLHKSKTTFSNLFNDAIRSDHLFEGEVYSVGAKKKRGKVRNCERLKARSDIFHLEF